jgi:hypothetical protein
VSRDLSLWVDVGSTMKKIVLISCVSKKLSQEAKAKDLYISQLFKLNLAYAYKLNPDKIFILSAKYGLLKLETTIEPYEMTLNTMSSSAVKEWAELVLADLKKEADLQSDKIIFLAGERYRRYLIPALTHYEVPLSGLPIGKQLQYLGRRV